MEYKLEAYVDEFVDYDWLWYGDPKTDEVYNLREEENQKIAAKAWGISPDLVAELDSSMRDMANEIIKAVKKDLADCYERE